MVIASAKGPIREISKFNSVGRTKEDLVEKDRRLDRDDVEFVTDPEKVFRLQR